MAEDASVSNDQTQVQDNLVTTKHSVVIDGKEIKYTATTGTLVLKYEDTATTGEEAGKFAGHKAKAEVFFVAYSRDNIKKKAKRPLTFSFNGGPGSSSIWMHLGALGPRRVLVEDTEATPPPYRLSDNEFSLLDKTDLVFIDPVGTGFSRPIAGEKAQDFHSLKRDVESVSAFIRLYISRYERWLSPLFLIGESYGTTRASALSAHLQDTHGINLNGLMLISAVLDFGTLSFHHNNDLCYALFLPTYSATAWYHQALPAKLQKKKLRTVLDEVEDFVRQDYVPALFQGSSLSSEASEAIAQKLAHFTGLSADFIQNSNLRVTIWHFTKELLRQRQETVGRIDSRYLGRDRNSAGAMFEYDPSLAATTPPYSAAFNSYVRNELEYHSDVPYTTLSYDVNKNWQWESDNQYVDVAESLRKTMCANPHMKVHVANGYYDLATPHFATEYTFDHLSLAPALRDNISMSYYEAGHMMYVHMPSLEKFKRSLAAFIEEACP